MNGSMKGGDHGGNLAAARRCFPGAPEPWIDLSTGINPWPYPFTAPLSWSWHRLPDSDQEDQLREAVAAYVGGKDPEQVVLAPGSQALIQWLPRLRPIGRVAVLAPTYAEHAVAWSQAGHRVSEITLAHSGTCAGMPQDLLERGKFDVVVVVNPNNPDGRLLPTASLRLLAEAQAERGGWLVVDEAFADVLSVPDGMGMAGAAGTSTGGVPGLLVMRSFGKFFGLAGVRLGYLLTTPALARQIHRALGPWAVAGPALAIATEALRDRSWIEATRSKLSAAAAALDQVLRAGGLEVIGGTSLFRLTRTPSPAARLYSALAAAGILVRRFDHHKSWLRFGLPGDEAAICRLERVLQKECLR